MVSTEGTLGDTTNMNKGVEEDMKEGIAGWIK